MSALHPYTVKAETARACTQTRAETSQDKERASLAKGRRGREEGLNAAPATTVVEEQFEEIARL